MSCYFPHVIKNNIKNQRLRIYLQNNFLNFGSKKFIKKCLDRNEFFVNNKRATTATIVNKGDVIDYEETETTSRTMLSLGLPVIFEDEYLAVINKPAGIEVSGNKYYTIENALTYNLKKSSLSSSLKYPRPVHRLDFHTSGLLIVAKEAKSLRELSNLFEKRKIEKKYVAIVMGFLEGNGFIKTMENNIESVTKFKVLETILSLRSNFLTIVELSLMTGRTHQLRKHMKLIKHPILGDRLYGEVGNIFYGKGLFLTAYSLRFSHPITGNLIDLKINLPSKFNKQIEKEKLRWNKFNS